MVPFGAGLFGWVVVVGGLTLAVSGAWRLFVGRSRQFPEVRPVLVRGEGLLRLVLAPFPVLTGWAAVPIAEWRTDWVDEDGNGMLDPFVNGQYDWMDRNLSDWLFAWGVMNAVVGGVAVALLVIADRRLNRAATCPREGDGVAVPTDEHVGGG